MKYLVCLMLALMLTGCGEMQVVETLDIVAVETVRERILGDLGLDPQGEYLPEDLTYLAREFVYRTNTWPKESTQIDVELDFLPTYEAWKMGEASFKCGGSAYTLAWMIEQLGVPARGVQLAAQTFLEGETDLDTHVTTEVYLKGKWVMHDPTFNASFRCHGKDASILDLVECEEPEAVLGVDQSKHTLEAYPIPYMDFLAAYSFNNPYASRLRLDPDQDFPFEGWDD